MKKIKAPWNRCWRWQQQWHHTFTLDHVRPCSWNASNLKFGTSILGNILQKKDFFDSGPKNVQKGLKWESCANLVLSMRHQFKIWFRHSSQNYGITHIFFFGFHRVRAPSNHKKEICPKVRLLQKIHYIHIKYIWPHLGKF